MSDVSELKKLVKDLQSVTTNEERVSILQILKKNFQVNESILRESKAGLAVGKLRTHDVKEISDLAKEIVKKWKNEVERAKGGSGSKSTANAKSTGAAPRKPVASATPASGSVTPASNGKSEVRTAKSDGVKISVSGDTMRDRCIELIYDGLACDSAARKLFIRVFFVSIATDVLNIATNLILGRAKGVEQAVFAQFGRTSPEYKGKVRSLFVNLKDKGNPNLRESIVSGEVSPEKFSKMTSEEMMSEERRATDQKIKEENLFKSLGAGAQEAETEGFQCGRCKQRKCRYRQAQTRSADEPMTTFVTCVNCGHKWKFS
ncbi:transcription factor S-II, central domain-containing protein [Pisolithus orientalis]|uniref:transcription factor S-II, central domain-containing protein n=1 Tax=Pisolithus orientalis TaxID=936130 RepID=UPI00222598A8|nr:transcription factor S-II, central domain-containing protein [Pisolithus orientalis]KAI6008874.1 transcription factor S-II, central domain-containing protein [Pisolithus orientalis]